MLHYIINQLALRSETIVETKLHTVSNLSKVNWDAPKISVFGAFQRTFGPPQFVKALLDIQY